MSGRTTIEWTDSTWNPVTGCTKVSPGCHRCYAETISRRFGGTPAFPHGFDVTLRPERLDQPLRWRKPRRVFVNSMSDLFHTDVPDEYIARIFAVMALAPEHTFQVLTKRHGRMRSLFNSDLREQVAEEITDLIAGGVRLKGARLVFERDTDAGNLWAPETWPLPNVWLGVSVEDQKRADLRIPALLRTPAAVRFLSCEPLLGPVDLTDYLGIGHGGDSSEDGPSLIDWVIAGGESGHDARPMHPDWARCLRDQSQAVGVAYHFKQWGEWAESANGVTIVHQNGEITDSRIPLPSGAARMTRVGKKAAGRSLDGRTYDQYPDE